MNNRYGGIIWTNHALNRLSERRINQADAWYTFQHPQNSESAKTMGAWAYYRTFDQTRIEVVAKQNDRKEWVIISVWSEKTPDKEVNPETASWLMKLLNFFKRSLSQVFL